MIDLGKFLTILMLFESGFTVLIVAMNQPYHEIVADNDDKGDQLLFREENTLSCYNYSL